MLVEAVADAVVVDAVAAVVRLHVPLPASKQGIGVVAVQAAAQALH